MTLFSRQVSKQSIIHLSGLLVFSFLLLYFFNPFTLSKTQNPDNLLKQTEGVTTSVFLTKNGTHLELYGQPYSFTGVNVFNAATLYGSNAGCGGMVEDLDGFFASLRPNSIVRFWGWQGSMVTNINTKQPDFTGIDRVLTVASKHNQRVIVSFGDQSGTCDDGLWKDKAWYNGGFTQIYNPYGMTPLSYFDFVQQVVTRYKDSSTIAMWELMNEPEASECAPGYTGSVCYGHQLCPDGDAAAQSLRYFYDTVGGKIKEIDPNHLIESGLIGTGQCGTDNWHYQYLHESPSLDVASYHDYNEPDNPMPGDQWNGLQVRLNQMRTIQKPLIIGETGMLAQDNKSDCVSFVGRRDKTIAKMNTQFPAGIAGYIPWAWTAGNGGICNYDIPATDPLLQVLHDFPLLEVALPITPTLAVEPTPTIPRVIPTATIIPVTIAPTVTVPTLTIPTPTPVIVKDGIPPLISVLKPVNGSKVDRNSTVQILANISDNVAVANVIILVQNVQQCVLTQAPYSCNWKLTGKKDAIYTIDVRAIDTSNNTTTAQVKVQSK